MCSIHRVSRLKCYYFIYYFPIHYVWLRAKECSVPFVKLCQLCTYVHRYLRFWDMFNSEVPEQVAVVTNALCASYSPDGAVLAVG